MTMTKVFQRVLAIFIVVATIFLANGLNNVANAARVQLYDGKVDDILNDIRKSENYIKKYKEDAEFRDYFIKGMKEKGLSDIQIKELMSIDLKLRGTHYYTGTDGFRYCESYFGDSDKNRLAFQVNNNGAVSSAWIIAPMYTMAGEDNTQGADISGIFLDSIFDIIGLSDSESDNIMDSLMTWNKNNARIRSEADKALNNNDNQLYNKKMNEIRSNFPKTFSVWCSKSKRYINLQYSVDFSNESATIFIYSHI